MNGGARLGGLDDLVERLQAVLDDVDVPQSVGRIVTDLVDEPEELAAVLEGAADGFGVLYRDERLTVLHAVVPPGVVSPPHEHRMWAVIGVLEGTEENHFYERRTDGRLSSAGERSLTRGDVAVLPADAVHHICNPGPTQLRALHVYGGDLLGVERSQWNPDTGDEEPFGISLPDRT